MWIKFSNVVFIILIPAPWSPGSEYTFDLKIFPNKSLNLLEFKKEKFINRWFETIPLIATFFYFHKNWNNYAKFYH